MLKKSEEKTETKRLNLGPFCFFALFFSIPLSIVFGSGWYQGTYINLDYQSAPNWRVDYEEGWEPEKVLESYDAYIAKLESYPNLQWKRRGVVVDLTQAATHLKKLRPALVDMLESKDPIVDKVENLNNFRAFVLDSGGAFPYGAGYYYYKIPPVGTIICGCFFALSLALMFVSFVLLFIDDVYELHRPCAKKDKELHRIAKAPGCS